jgi:hypothetical protein
MSYDFQLIMKNKHQKHSKVNLHQYIDNSDEPQDNVFRDTQPSLEVELLEDTLSMRQRFRHTAQRLRNHT